METQKETSAPRVEGAGGFPEVGADLWIHLTVLTKRNEEEPSQSEKHIHICVQLSLLLCDENKPGRTIEVFIWFVCVCVC